MEVKKIDDTQITNAIDLIWQTFLQFEAPDYSEEGVKSFQDFIENKEIIKTLEFWGAYDEEELKGVIATNENRKHICCFFVKHSIKDKALVESCGTSYEKIVQAKPLQ